MAFSITSNYSGEVADGFKVKLLTGNQMFEGGHINVIPQVRDRIHIPRMTLDNVVQDRVATPSASVGTPTVTEVTAIPQDFMIYYTFNPRDWESYWTQYQPSGPLVFRELPANVQSVLLNETAKRAANWLGLNIWLGNTGGSSPNDKFNGLLQLAGADGTVVDIASPVALTNANIVSKLAEIREATDPEVWDHPDFKIFMGRAESHLFLEAVENQSNKGNDFTTTGPLSYWGKPIVPITGMTANTMYATIASADMDSNIHLAVDWAEDGITDVFQIERLQANSELFFVKALMKGAVQHAFGEYITLYTV